MKKIIKSPLQPRKKISLDINTTILDLIKDLAELTHTNNTIIIESLLINGIAPSIRAFKIQWVTLLGDTKDKQRKEILNGLLDKLIKISEKKEYRHLIEG